VAAAVAAARCWFSLRHAAVGRRLMDLSGRRGVAEVTAWRAGRTTWGDDGQCPGRVSLICLPPRDFASTTHQPSILQINSPMVVTSPNAYIVLDEIATCDLSSYFMIDFCRLSLNIVSGVSYRPITQSYSSVTKNDELIALESVNSSRTIVTITSRSRRELRKYNPFQNVL